MSHSTCDASNSADSWKAHWLRTNHRHLGIAELPVDRAALENLILVGLLCLRRCVWETLCLRQESQTIAGGKGDNAISGAQTHKERDLRQREGRDARSDIPEILVLARLVIVVRMGLHEGSCAWGEHTVAGFAYLYMSSYALWMSMRCVWRSVRAFRRWFATDASTAGLHVRVNTDTPASVEGSHIPDFCNPSGKQRPLFVILVALLNRLRKVPECPP